MKLFDVYPLFDVNIVKGQGCKVWDWRTCRHLHRSLPPPLYSEGNGAVAEDRLLLELSD